MNWTDIQYLRNGNDIQRKCYSVLTELEILPLLSKYDPVVVGTIPIEIDIEGSDVDIICSVSDLTGFRELICHNFSGCHFFADKINDDMYVADFEYSGIKIEIYAEDCPTQMQAGYRHMIVENRILSLGGCKFKGKVIEVKKRGIKTEPAFGKLLGLENPYTDLLDLEKLSDDELGTLMEKVM